MHEDVNLLGEVVVKGNRPSYKLTAEGLQTHVQGTVLSKMGTAEDVLKHIPGLQKKNDAYEVFGKGSPIIYVNGRLLRDLSELDQLKSEDIKNVELITSPGARYDASVKAVWMCSAPCIIEKVKGLTKVGLLKMCMLIRFGIRTIISSQKRINRHLPISQV